MPAARIRIQFEQMEKVAKAFRQEGQSVRQTTARLKQKMEVLQAGDWAGTSAEKFYADMTGNLLPKMQRLAAALEASAETTDKIIKIMHDGEETAAAIMRRRENLGDDEGGGGILSKIGDALSSAGKFLGDLLIGAGSELVDMVTGIGSALLHPVDTLMGLAYGITHPVELFNAFTKNYVDDWNSGHPGRAIGRGALFIASFFVGAGEAKVGAEAGKLGELGDAARVMRSSNELMGIEKATPELIEAVAKRRSVMIAKEGSEELRYLDYLGAEANVGGPDMTHILLRENPSKAAVLEEFLHGTQQKLGIVDELGFSGLGSAETHVKDFMIRHQRLLGLSNEDVEILKILRDKGL